MQKRQKQLYKIQDRCRRIKRSTVLLFKNP
jgi:hypothetical protein